MGSRDFKNIIMQYLTLRWFTLSNFSKENLKLFHSLEHAINKTVNHKLCWHKQTENYLKKEFNLLINRKNSNINKVKNFDVNLQKFLRQNNLKEEIFLNNIEFLQKCDEIIYHKANCHKTASDINTSLP